MTPVKGTTGYSQVVDRFIEATDAIDFCDLHRPYLDLIPAKPGRVLDVGAGTGRDASVFSGMGHNVIAVEPLSEFRAAAQRLHASPAIEWVDDSLPLLQKLHQAVSEFDFVLASGVWHHLDKVERQQALERIVGLMKPGAVFALSLRNGPAGAGTHLFPTDEQETIRSATSSGLKTLVHLSDQPSLMRGKEKVRWTYLAFARNSA